jgi:hypothetical protein
MLHHTTVLFTHGTTCIISRPDTTPRAYLLWSMEEPMLLPSSAHCGNAGCLIIKPPRSASLASPSALHSLMAPKLLAVATPAAHAAAHASCERCERNVTLRGLIAVRP